MVADNGAEKPKATGVRGRSAKRKASTKVVVSSTGVEVSNCYCRKCMETKAERNFFQATNTYLDSNGKCSICKDCISSMYQKIFQNEHTIQKTLLRICRLLDWKYSDAAINAVTAQLETQKKLPDDPSVPGLYRSKLHATQKSEIGKRSEEDLTFVEPSHIEIVDPLTDDVEGAHDLKKFWGEKIGDFNDYVFLEERLAVWKESYSCSNASEEFYLREICFKELELRRARVEEKPVDTILKSMNDLLKNSALTPAQATAASGSKVADTLGMLIKRVETTQPCEYYKDKNLFQNYDNLGVYISNYIKRPILNFLSGNKDFELINEDDVNISLEDESAEAKE